MSLHDKDKGEPKIYPYPSWNEHDFNRCDSIQNIVDIFIDPNNILWTLDVGVIHTLKKPKTVGPPRVMGIDTATTKVNNLIS